MIKNTNDETLTLEKLSNFLKEVFENQFDNYDNTIHPFPIGYVGNGMYHIGNGTMTGEKGWIDFNELLIKEAKFVTWDKGLSPPGSIFNSPHCVEHDTDVTVKEIEEFIKTKTS